MEKFSKLQKWRLILGKEADQEDPVALNQQGQGMDESLNELYENANSRGGLGGSSPKVNRWLGDIRKYFPSSVVQVLQKDALDRLGIEKMLLEPEVLEMIDMDVNLVATLLSLNKVMPNQTKTTAKEVVRKMVEKLRKQLENPMREAIRGALSKAVRNRRPKYNEIDWTKTIRLNLKHYQPDYKTIIPRNLIGAGRKGQALRDIILCVDQSGSMGSSVVYSSIFGAVLASLPAVRTHMVVFDTAVADLTKELNDPVDLLFGTQLGGGTDINKALSYTSKLVQKPEDTILVLITDLYEGGNEQEMLQKAQQLKQSGINFITLLALNDEGAPIYDRSVAARLGQLGIPVFACTPDLFPDMMATAIKKESLSQWMTKNNVPSR
ncbi:MAG: VWA domain-containing protein [Saprospiraceae bacterium]|nr:VWA domain-containing protein [Saprospiraceae bacterium]